jgi:hypothetical protein
MKKMKLRERRKEEHVRSERKDLFGLFCFLKACIHLLAMPFIPYD